MNEFITNQKRGASSSTMAVSPASASGIGSGNGDGQPLTPLDHTVTRCRTCFQPTTKGTQVMGKNGDDIQLNSPGEVGLQSAIIVQQYVVKPNHNNGLQSHPLLRQNKPGRINKQRLSHTAATAAAASSISSFNSSLISTATPSVDFPSTLLPFLYDSICDSCVQRILHPSTPPTCHLCGDGDTSNDSYHCDGCDVNYCLTCLTANYGLGSTRNLVHSEEDAEAWLCFSCQIRNRTIMMEAYGGAIESKENDTIPTHPRQYLALTDLLSNAASSLQSYAFINPFTLEHLVPGMTYHTLMHPAARTLFRQRAINSSNAQTKKGGKRRTLEDTGYVTTNDACPDQPIQCLEYPSGYLLTASTMNNNETLPITQPASVVTDPEEYQRSSSAASSAAAFSSSTSSALQLPTSQLLRIVSTCIYRHDERLDYHDQWNEHIKYLYGLLQMIHQFRTIFPANERWVLRIYYDRSMEIPCPCDDCILRRATGKKDHYPLADIWKSLRNHLETVPFVQLRYWNWPCYQHFIPRSHDDINRHGFHLGHLGMMSRFLALADLGLTAELVVFSDVDGMWTKKFKRELDIMMQRRAACLHFKDVEYSIPLWGGASAYAFHPNTSHPLIFPGIECTIHEFASWHMSHPTILKSHHIMSMNWKAHVDHVDEAAKVEVMKAALAEAGIKIIPEWTPEDIRKEYHQHAPHAAPPPSPSPSTIKKPNKPPSKRPSKSRGLSAHDIEDYSSDREIPFPYGTDQAFLNYNIWPRILEIEQYTKFAMETKKTAPEYHIPAYETIHTVTVQLPAENKKGLVKPVQMADATPMSTKSLKALPTFNSFLRSYTKIPLEADMLDYTINFIANELGDEWRTNGYSPMKPQDPKHNNSSMASNPLTSTQVTSTTTAVKYHPQSNCSIEKSRSSSSKTARKRKSSKPTEGPKIGGVEGDHYDDDDPAEIERQISAINAACAAEFEALFEQARDGSMEEDKEENQRLASAAAAAARSRPAKRRRLNSAPSFTSPSALKSAPMETSPDNFTPPLTNLRRSTRGLHPVEPIVHFHHSNSSGSSLFNQPSLSTFSVSRVFQRSDEPEEHKSNINPHFTTPISSAADSINPLSRQSSVDTLMDSPSPLVSNAEQPPPSYESAVIALSTRPGIPAASLNVSPPLNDAFSSVSPLSNPLVSDSPSLGDPMDISRDSTPVSPAPTNVSDSSCHTNGSMPSTASFTPSSISFASTVTLPPHDATSAASTLSMTPESVSSVVVTEMGDQESEMDGDEEMVANRRSQLKEDAIVIGSDDEEEQLPQSVPTPTIAHDPSSSTPPVSTITSKSVPNTHHHLLELLRTCPDAGVTFYLVEAFEEDTQLSDQWLTGGYQCRLVTCSQSELKKLLDHINQTHVTAYDSTRPYSNVIRATATLYHFLHG